MAQSAYAHHVGDREPVAVLRSSLDDYAAIAARLTADDWRRPWQPGKWTFAQIMVHVAQWEMILGVRLRCGVAVPGYTVQPIEQDPLMEREGTVVDGPTALAAFDAMRRMNLAFASSLSAEDRRRPFKHPEFGEVDAEYMLITMAGHGVHHWKQLAGTGRE
jgi:hypothetical protein